MAEFLGDGVGKGDVANDAAAKEGMLEIALGAVEELVGQNDIAGAIFFLEGANGADADDPGDAEFFHGPKIGAVIQFSREDAVAAAMRHFAQRTGADTDVWEAVGLLHDMDYERHPNIEQSATEGHPFVAVAWLRAQGWSEEICRAILSHADYAGVARVTPLERTLYAVDELSGFVTAVARVRPGKSIHEVDVAAVKKKMKDKAFARSVNRQDIVEGAQELGIPLEEHIDFCVKAMQARADELGLKGNASASA